MAVYAERTSTNVSALENQTDLCKMLTLFSDRLIRTSIMLTLSVCYIMWMSTYLAQLHPLIGMFLGYRPTLYLISPIAPHKVLGASE